MTSETSAYAGGAGEPVVLVDVDDQGASVVEVMTAGPGERGRVFAMVPGGRWAAWQWPGQVLRRTVTLTVWWQQLLQVVVCGLGCWWAWVHAGGWRGAAVMLAVVAVTTLSAGAEGRMVVLRMWRADHDAGTRWFMPGRGSRNY